jgi:hypothetical protein
MPAWSCTAACPVCSGIWAQMGKVGTNIWKSENYTANLFFYEKENASKLEIKAFTIKPTFGSYGFHSFFNF